MQYCVMYDGEWWNVHDQISNKIVDGFDNKGDAYSFMYFLENNGEEWLTEQERKCLK